MTTLVLFPDDGHKGVETCRNIQFDIVIEVPKEQVCTFCRLFIVNWNTGFVFCTSVTISDTWFRFYTVNYLSLWRRVLLVKLTFSQLVKNMEPEGSLPHSQDPAICPCTVPDQSSPYPQSHFLKINFNIILPSRPCSCKWSLSLRFIHQDLARNSPLPHTS